MSRAYTLAGSALFIVGFLLALPSLAITTLGNKLLGMGEGANSADTPGSDHSNAGDVRLADVLKPPHPEGL